MINIMCVCSCVLFIAYYNPLSQYFRFFVLLVEIFLTISAATKPFSSTTTINFLPRPNPHKTLLLPQALSLLVILKNKVLDQFFESQRKSCDVIARHTLWSLFSIDDNGDSSLDIKFDHPKFMYQIKSQLGSLNGGAQFLGMLVVEMDEDRHKETVEVG